MTNPIPIGPTLSRIGQIFVNVKDLGRAIAFYRDILGMTFLFQAPPAMAFFDCGGIRLMLGVADRPDLGHVRRDLTDKPFGVNIAQLFGRDPVEIVAFVAEFREVMVEVAKRWA